jgi:hypothetical protein
MFPAYFGLLSSDQSGHVLSHEKSWAELSWAKAVVELEKINVCTVLYFLLSWAELSVAKLELFTSWHIGVATDTVGRADYCFRAKQSIGS